MTEELPPPPASFADNSRAQLEADLRHAQDVLRSDPRAGAKAALSAVVEFLNHDPAWARADLSLPLWSLLSALEDLNKGRVAPMLAPNPDIRHRAPDSSLRQIVRGYAVYTVDRLRVGGCSTDGACRAVATILRQQGYAVGGRTDTPDWKVIRGWRSQMSKRDPGSDQDRIILDALHADMDLASVPIEDAVNVAIDNLRTVLEKLGKTALE